MLAPILNFRPITGRLRLQRPLSTHADEIVIVDKGRTWNARPLIHPEGELDRIKGHANSDPSANLERIECKNIAQGPTRLLLLRDVVIADGVLHGPGWVQPISEARRRLILPSASVRLVEAACVSTHVSEKFFGHWLHDQLPSELLADEISVPAVAFPGTHRPHEEGYRRLTDLRVQKQEVAHVDSLWVFEDHELTDHRVTRIQTLRGRIRSKTAQAGPSLVYISRGSLGVGRGIANPEAVEDALEALGFTILHPEQMEPVAIAMALSSAKLVLSPEGSALAHAIMCAPAQSTVVALMSPHHFNMIFRLYCEAVDMNFGMFIGDETESGAFEVDACRLRRFVETLSI